MNLILFSTPSIHLNQVFKRKTWSKLIVCMIICLFFSAVSSSQTRYYVDQSIANSGDGKTWGAAFKTLQEGINAASSSVADEIWVAKGTYIPNTNFYGTRYDAPQYSYSMTFFLKNRLRSMEDSLELKPH